MKSLTALFSGKVSGKLSGVLPSVVGSDPSAENGEQIHWQHRLDASPAFNSNMFDDAWLGEKNYIVSSPTAGRGASLFLKIDSANLVLRHYRRGGLVRGVSEDQYVWLGLNRTRAWREFGVLSALEQLALPSPRPYACQVRRLGRSYGATLITYFLEGATLAERVCTATLPKEHWFAIGHCVRRFHVVGVFHADLNAHNILIDDFGAVSIIDFDRAVMASAVGEQSGPSRRYKNNLSRLRRSLGKIVSSGPAYYDDDCWDAVLKGYESSG